MNISQYIEKISTRYRLGNATEHTFRGDLQNLIEALVPGAAATNEPKRIACGAPDYVLTRGVIPIGYIEAKDIGVDLKGKAIKEQRDRYRESLDNLIFTDYLDFHLYHNGEFVASARIAELDGGRIVPLAENFEHFAALMDDFSKKITQSIKGAKRLAEMMAGKAKMLARVIENALKADEGSQENSSLRDQMKAFKQILIHDIDEKGFADIYAQTIAYGMFAARLHDPDLETFTRQEAAVLIPQSNPFLRKLFQYIAGYDLDERITWIVDALADIFRAADVRALLADFGKATQQNDPIIHFYETFLAEYDPKLRKSRGVWYTPEPVVNFIVRAVDDILKTEFGLADGLADTSKTKIKLKTTVKDERTKSGFREEEKEVHKVQILDPATGTGTFLAEVIKQIHSRFANQQGIWSNYVENELIPRLNGFEILMASYAMAHLKLDLLLTETGYKPSGSPPRFHVYLTNSLEEHHPETGTLFTTWLSAEANEANHIKRDTPVMVVIGNPPYSGESSNKGEWIMSLMEDYKKEPGGKEKLKEKTSKWINDDYVKFLRMAQHLVEKNGFGIVAFVNNHGFLDNSTFRGMRWNLLKTFDQVFLIDLHGSTKKSETSPDGSPDKNVFDILPGVSINILIKNGVVTSKTLADVFHLDVWGSRESKYEFLANSNLFSLEFCRLTPTKPNYFFVPKDLSYEAKYNSGFSLSELFPLNNTGVVSKRDKLNIHFEKRDVMTMLNDLVSLGENEMRSKYSIPKDVRDWNFRLALDDISRNGTGPDLIRAINYRPFDKRFFYYSGKSKGIVGWPVPIVSEHLKHADNLGLMANKKIEVGGFGHCIVYSGIVESHAVSMKEVNYVFPLYLYPDDSQEKGSQAGLPLDVRKSSAFPSDAEQEASGSAAVPHRVPNLNMEIVGKIAEGLGLEFVSEPGAAATGFLDSAAKNPVTIVPGSDKSSTTPSAEAASNPPGTVGEFKTFAPIDILDYIYAVLHSPTYREKYKEFLKIDFPRVPYPKDAETFWRLVALGGELRRIHLLESPVVNKFITGYPVTGDNAVVKPEYKNGSVYINPEQYFSDVPETAWNFYIGGYQPAQKWLKDRKGRTLSFDDIRHYQKIIVALAETARIMKEIDRSEYQR